MEGPASAAAGRCAATPGAAGSTTDVDPPPRSTEQIIADALLDDLLERRDRLQAVDGATSHYTDARYRKRNGIVLDQMRSLATQITRNYPDQPAAARAAAIARELGLPTSAAATRPRQEIVVDATIRETSIVPTAQQIAPYKESLVYIRYTVDAVRSGAYADAQIVVVHWGMRNRQFTPAAKWQPGLQQRLTIEPFDTYPALSKLTAASSADDPMLMPYWATAVAVPQ